jgi:hypothetical protein
MSSVVVMVVLEVGAFLLHGLRLLTLSGAERLSIP